MLVLTRRPHEAVMIGHDIQILVLEITDERVRIGITAPREIPVMRQELLRQTTSAAAPQ